jgi:hypothetical protein
MKNKYFRIVKFISASVFFLMLLIPQITLSQEITNFNESERYMFPEETSKGNEYKGYLRVYIVELLSRWRMDSGLKYHNALLDFAYNDEISIRYQETYEDTLSWTGDIDKSNVIVLAALFNKEGYTNYADPPEGRPFTAHYVDAAAGAKPDETGTNTVNEDFTHTVFAEKGTATWCPACPYMASKLKNIYESGDYPFYYVSMVVDKSSDADRRMDDFNLRWLPTAFYDGGKEVVVGGTASIDDHKAIIEEIGQRDVHELDLSLTVEWIGDGGLDIQLSITNNEEVENNPPATPSISGPEKGKTGTNIEFALEAVDPDGDDLNYIIDWGDESGEESIGPYSSGQEVKVSHTWEVDGEYSVKAKAVDMDGAESDWVTITVTMPKLRAINFNLMLNWFISRIKGLLI